MILSAIENATDIGNNDLKIREYSSCSRRGKERQEYLKYLKYLKKVIVKGILKKVIYKSNFIKTLHFEANLETGLVTAFVS